MTLPAICTTEQPYRASQFVPRPEAEETFQAWLRKARQDGVAAPFLLLEGPPGSGKSWLMQKWHTDINANYPQEGLRAVYLPWARWLTEKVSDVSPTPTLIRELWRAFMEEEPPPSLDANAVNNHSADFITLLLHHFFETYADTHGLVLLVDGLDRLEEAQIRAVERTWLRAFLEFGSFDRPIWIALVHYGCIDESRLRTQGQQTIVLEPLQAPTERWLPLRAAYGEAFRHWVGTAPAFDFRYPLLSAYWEAQRDALRSGTVAPYAWRLALACVFARRAAAHPWAAALQARDTAEDWLDSPTGQAFMRVFRMPIPEQAAPWHKIRVQDVAESDWRLLRPLLKGSFWQFKRYFYRLDASLARFFQDAVHMLSQGSR